MKEKSLLEKLPHITAQEFVPLAGIIAHFGSYSEIAKVMIVQYEKINRARARKKSRKK